VAHQNIFRIGPQSSYEREINRKHCHKIWSQTKHNWTNILDKYIKIIKKEKNRYIMLSLWYWKIHSSFLNYIFSTYSPTYQLSTNSALMLFLSYIIGLCAPKPIYTFKTKLIFYSFYFGALG
jgi:hypothetical protein